MLELEVDTGEDFPATVRVDGEGRVTHIEVDGQTDEVYVSWAHFCEAVGIEDSEAAFEKVEDQIDPGVLEEVKTMDLDNADAILAECARKMAEPVKGPPVNTAPKMKTAPKVKTAPVKAPPKVQAKKMSTKKAKKATVPPTAKKKTAKKKTAEKKTAKKKTAKKTTKKAKARKR